MHFFSCMYLFHFVEQLKCSNWAESAHTLMSLSSISIFSFLALLTQHLVSTMIFFLVTYSDRIYFSDVSHRLVLTVASSIIKWNKLILANYLFFYATKLAKFVDRREHRDTRTDSKISNCASFYSTSLRIINIKHGNKQFQ